MRRLLLAVPALLLMLGAAVACSDNSDDGDGVATVDGNESENPGGSDTEQLSDEEQAQAFVDCMREQGIDMPDPDPNGEGGLLDLQELDIPREELQPALDACREYAPFGDNAGEPLDAETLAQMTEFAQCMRDNGIDVPDPDPNGGFGLGEGDIDPQDPDFQAAIEACQDLLAEFRPGAGGGQ
jgi:hypothetical protein